MLQKPIKIYLKKKKMNMNIIHENETQVIESEL